MKLIFNFVMAFGICCHVHCKKKKSIIQKLSDQISKIEKKSIVFELIENDQRLIFDGNHWQYLCLWVHRFQEEKKENIQRVFVGKITNYRIYALRQNSDKWRYKSIQSSDVKIKKFFVSIIIDFQKFLSIILDS